MNARLSALLAATGALLGAEIVFPGCATLTTGGKQTVRVESKTERARVIVDGKPCGPAPATLMLSRWGSHRVRIEAPGFAPYEAHLTKRWNDNANYNAYAGVAPILIDVISGAIFHLELPASEKLHETHLQEPSIVLEQPYTLVIAADLQPQPAWRRTAQIPRR